MKRTDWTGEQEVEKKEERWVEVGGERGKLTSQMMAAVLNIYDAGEGIH